MSDVERLAEALLAADQQDRRLDGYKLDVVHRYAAALLPAVDAIARERAAEELLTVMGTWEAVPAQVIHDRAVSLRTEPPQQVTP